MYLASEEQNMLLIVVCWLRDECVTGWDLIAPMVYQFPLKDGVALHRISVVFRSCECSGSEGGDGCSCFV